MNGVVENEPESGKELISPGHQLRVAREIYGLSEQEVADDLRLSTGVIEALEHDDDARLPSPTFVRGYIRSYAQRVGLAPDELIEQYNARVGAGPIQHLRSRSAPAAEVSHHLWIGTVAVVLVGILLVWAWAWWQQSRPVTQPLASEEESDAAAEIAAAPEAADTAKAATPAGPATETTPAAAVASSTAVTPAPGTAVAGDAAPALPATATPAPTTPEQGAGADQARLTLEFSGVSWVEVSDRKGQSLLRRETKAGEVQQVEGAPPFKVVLGNATVASVKYNGEPFDHQGFVKKGVARFQVPGQP